jgi:hypothetical protein
MIARIMLCLVICALLGGCAGRSVAISNDGFSIADIRVTSAGGKQPGQAYTTGVCMGFLLSEQQVRDFFVHANYIKDTRPDNRYNILPCYSSGTATINNASYQWVIRAGGVGEFTSTHHNFVKICGTKCCNKVEGIC